MKKALVCGAGGFIGGHLVKKLKREGYWVRGVDIKENNFSPSQADDFMLLDLREEQNCRTALTLESGGLDEVYQLAADMGGVGFLTDAESEILHNNALINIHMTHSAAEMGIPRYFFSSSVCIYRDMALGEAELSEDNAIPANPDNEYGWEKLYAERVGQAYAKKSGMQVRIARFQNCYGPEGEWQGGREKAPAAICRKVAERNDGGAIEIWGDGSAVRSFIYVDDLVDGVFTLMHSDIDEPTNIGSTEYVSINELVQIVFDIADRQLAVNHIDGPIGVLSRNFSNQRIESTGWRTKFTLKAGIAPTYDWIHKQVVKQG